MDNIGTILGVILLVVALVVLWMRFGGSMSAAPGMAGKVWKVIKWPLLVLVLFGLVRLCWYLWYNPQSSLNPIPTGAKITCTVTLPAEKFWEEQPLVCPGLTPGKYKVGVQAPTLGVLDPTDALGKGGKWYDIEYLRDGGEVTPSWTFRYYQGSKKATSCGGCFLVNGIPNGETVVIGDKNTFTVNMPDKQVSYLTRVGGKLDKATYQVKLQLSQ